MISTAGQISLKQFVFLFLFFVQDKWRGAEGYVESAASGCWHVNAARLFNGV